MSGGFRNVPTLFSCLRRAGFHNLSVSCQSVLFLHRNSIVRKRWQQEYLPRDLGILQGIQRKFLGRACSKSTQPICAYRGCWVYRQEYSRITDSMRRLVVHMKIITFLDLSAKQALKGNRSTHAPLRKLLFEAGFATSRSDEANGRCQCYAAFNLIGSHTFALGLTWRVFNSNSVFFNLLHFFQSSYMTIL